MTETLERPVAAPAVPQRTAGVLDLGRDGPGRLRRPDLRPAPDDPAVPGP